MRPRTENAKAPGFCGGAHLIHRRPRYAAEAVRALRHALAKHRRTLATGLQRLGVRLEVTEAVLNHLSGSRAGMVGIYQRHDWAEEKRPALDACGVGFRQLRTCRRTRPGQLCATTGLSITLI